MNKSENSAASRPQKTRSMIREALLRLLRKKDYIDISVTDICNKAGISRGTFYAYYSNTHQIIDELFQEALDNIGNVPLQHVYHLRTCRNCEGALCRFLRNNKKYQPLFLSDALYSQAVQLIVDSLSGDFLKNMKTHSDLPDDLLLALLYYQISGCMAITKKHITDSEEDWIRIQNEIDSFLCEGFRSV